MKFQFHDLDFYLDLALEIMVDLDRIDKIW